MCLFWIVSSLYPLCVLYTAHLVRKSMLPICTVPTARAHCAFASTIVPFEPWPFVDVGRSPTVVWFFGWVLGLGAAAEGAPLL